MLFEALGNVFGKADVASAMRILKDVDLIGLLAHSEKMAGGIRDFRMPPLGAEPGFEPRVRGAKPGIPRTRDYEPDKPPKSAMSL